MGSDKMSSALQNIKKPVADYGKTPAGKANFICFSATFLADMIIMGAFYGVAGAGVPIFFGEFIRAAWISNLAGCLFFAYGVNQVSILNRVNWKKVDFFSSIVNSVILGVCSLSLFILTIKWKETKGYGALVTSGGLTTVATLSKLYYIKLS